MTLASFLFFEVVPSRMIAVHRVNSRPDAPAETRQTASDMVTVAQKVQDLCNAVDEIRLDCEAQAKNATFPNIDESRKQNNALLIKMSNLEAHALGGIRALSQEAVTRKRVNDLDSRRANASNWFLPECKDCNPEMLSIDSDRAFVNALQTVHAWCARQIEAKLAPRQEIIRGLIAADVAGKRLEAEGRVHNAAAKPTFEQHRALKRAANFLFDGALRANDIAIHRSSLIRRIAEVRPLRANISKRELWDHLQMLLGEQGLAHLKLPSSPNSPLSAPPSEPSVSTDISSEPSEGSESISEPAQAARLQDAKRGTTRRERREKKLQRGNANVVHQPKFDVLRAVREAKKRARCIQDILMGINNNDMDKNAAALEFCLI